MLSPQHSISSLLQIYCKFAFLMVKQPLPLAPQMSPYRPQIFRSMLMSMAMRLFGNLCSLGMTEITNLDYTAAFKKDGLYIYKGAELIHYTSKSPDSTSWTLPIECPLPEANDFCVTQAKKCRFICKT
jgi:hypothetical protein